MWTAHIFAVFDLLNGFAYDSLMHHHLNNTASTQLLVLDGDKLLADSGDEVWLPLLKNVLAQNVKQVVFNFLPERASADFYPLAADSGKVVFGQQVLESNPYSNARLQSLPPATQGKKITLGLIRMPKSQNGVYRTQSYGFRIADNHLPTLESITAQQVSGKSLALSAPDYRINFIGGSEIIPKVKLTQAVTGSVISELITGRTVLVGVYGMESSDSYFTPLSLETSVVLYHVFALDTLLAEKEIRDLPEWIMLLLIICITLITLIYAQGLSFQPSLIVSILYNTGLYAEQLATIAKFIWVDAII